jgi:hypothetical protein
MLVSDVDEVTVRGHQALVARVDPGGGDTDAWVVSWAERPGEVVRVTGIGISRAETLAVAEGVSAADDAEWADLVEQTLLGDLRTDLSEMEELGRGRFADGTAWVLRLRPATSGPKGESSASLDLSVAIAGDGDTSSSFSSVGTAIDGPGGETPAPPTFSATTVRRQAGRAFGAGLLTDRVTVVEVVQADGRTRWLAEIVRANGVVAWVAEIPADATELVARDATGAEVGRETIPQESADGSSGDGSGSSSGSGSNGSETTVVVGTPIGPTTTTG